jgi:molybdate transport system substrate-binding protein
MRQLRPLAAALAAFLSIASAQADEIRVVTSGGLSAAFKILAPEFERKTGHKIIMEWGPSMGATYYAVPQRLARGEQIDMVIMAGYALGKMVDNGQALDRTELATAYIGAVVKKGAPVPDISTVDALKKTMLAAKSIAYSDSASGVYIQNEMLKKLGIEDQVKAKSRMIPATPVAEIVAAGEAELGFQALSELLPTPGVTVIGLLPEGAQHTTTFAAGVIKGAKSPDAAHQLIRFLSSPEVAETIRKTGMEPITVK